MLNPPFFLYLSPVFRIMHLCGSEKPLAGIPPPPLFALQKTGHEGTNIPFKLYHIRKVLFFIVPALFPSLTDLLRCARNRLGNTL